MTGSGEMAWLRETFLDNLDSVHQARCTGGGPEHVCDLEKTRAEQVFSGLAAAVRQARAAALEEAADAYHDYHGQLRVEFWLRQRALAEAAKR